MSTLVLPQAQDLIAAAMSVAAADYQRPICAAVCDAQGFLMAFGRELGAPARSIQISQAKAYTAARMGIPTDAFLARLQRDNLEIGYFCDERFTALPGGAVLKNARGEAIGGIGVSGLTSAQDHAIVEIVAARFAQILS